MSINHFFSHISHHHHHHNMEPNSSWPSSLNFNLNQDSSPLTPQNHPHVLVVDKESLFEKPLTPSDVGKLNRLVIPKQHAEKYFPLAGDSGDKGLLLSFEDESGKCWRFRYSYWNSSQSYVLTKGWSRYVKEKQLDAGDVVLFQRHRTELDRLFIGWRRRGENCNNSNDQNNGGVMVQGSNCGGWNRGLMYSSSSSSNSGQQQQHGSHGGINAVGGGSNVSYEPDPLHAGSASQNQPITLGNSKKFRLFGVNLECQLDESEPSTPDDGSPLSSQGPNSAYRHFYSQSALSSNSHNRMDITFSQDVNQMRNRRG